ncbi:MAG TPA: inositol monophosphatase family protein [Nitrospiria bacterium]|jgi:myo-inositol-1(or 4)-monophosphatase|nr:inositol monophosphatase family protein [Nitrospiria bacterium]
MRNKTEPSPFLDVALQAAKAGGKVLRKFFATDMRIDFKGEVNLVTEADRAAEAVIVRTIRRRFPDHRFLAEEGGEHATPESIGSDHKWIVDPLDGTTNFAHSFPMFCVSIGLETRGEVVLGLVYDPLHEEMFLAEKGKGATLNGRRIHVSKTEKLNASLLVTGFAYDVRQDLLNNLDHFSNFSLRVQGVRRTGSAALDLCYVACGRFDGFWEMKLSPWDTAAGSLIATEAGATVTDFGNRPYQIYLKEILASNGKIHREMVEVLESAKRSGR